MATKLSRYAEAIMEMAWLAALIVVPVFFNVYSSRIFEPDKISLLRSLALLILGAWLVKLLDQGGGRWTNLEPGQSRWKSLLRVPMVLPVAALAVVYLISTIFSVAPSTSLWGSYQRLQGTYTLFSYLVVFAAIAANMRRREQIERLFTVAIIASLPVSLYGVLQRYKLDPIPWGGETSIRIASNMGNSIFVAAYLIMVFPLTAVRIIQTFQAMLKGGERMAAKFVLATTYVFIAALQVIAMYFSQSRGPALGWMFSIFFMGLALSLLWRKRWIAYTMVGGALLAGAFLLVLNIPNGPLESLRNAPGVGRFGQLLDADSRNAKVRLYIWEGAARLVAPHEPLEFPDGSTDRFNVLRPLIGYGPESMYVAYNPFYPPELTQVEKRNASPDRSHNETWDSLVITGVLGLAVYLALFTSVFYYGLKWLGFINSDKQRNLFFGLFFGVGALSAAAFVTGLGVAYFGVGLPFGMLIGLVIYLILVSLFGRYRAAETEGERLRSLAIIGLLAVVGAHFVEINFGIAIVSTRTYFFTAIGMLLVAGFVLPKTQEYKAVETSGAAQSGAERSAAALGSAQPAGGRGKKKRRAPSRPAAAPIQGLSRQALIGGLLLSIILATLGYNLISTTSGATTTTDILQNSFTVLPRENNRQSYGILAMLLITWVAGVLVFASENASAREGRDWLKAMGLTAGSSLFLTLFFWFWHAASLAYLATNVSSTMEGVLEQIGGYEFLLTRYVIYLLFLVLFGAALLPDEWPGRGVQFNWVGAVAPATLLVVMALSAYTNLRVIQADVAFKLAEPFIANGQWPVAVQIYRRANSMAPREDYYYLFLGRAYLEHAKTLSAEDERDSLIMQAAVDLRRAQILNPLNTDHTANLARLYSLWSTYSSDPALKEERAVISSQFFARAVTLSPNNARLWDEWALVFLNLLNQLEEARQRLERSLEVDPFYDWTYALLGDYYGRTAQSLGEEQSDERQQAFEKAGEAYTRALELATETNMKYSYALALAGVHTRLNEPAAAIAAYQQALDLSPNNSESWKIEESIALLYSQNGNHSDALAHAQKALALAPEDQKQRLQALVSQLNGQQ